MRTGTVVVTADNPSLTNDSVIITTQAGAATDIITEASPGEITADGISISTITATVVDANDNKVNTATDNITFSIQGEGSWWDNTTENKQVQAISGIATIRAKSTTEAGSFTVETSAP